MHPLSAWVYFRRNRRRVLPVLAIIAMSVFGVVLVVNLAETALEDGRRDFIDPSRVYARVVARKEGLDPNLSARLRHHDAVERVVPMLRREVRKWGLFGTSGSPVFGIHERDSVWFMDRTGLRLVEGRLPSGSQPEVALHDSVMKNKGVRIGDVIGREANPEEFLPGRFTIVGRLTGPVQFGIAPEVALRQSTGTLGEIYVFPKPGRMAEVDAYLTPLDGDIVRVDSASTLQRSWQQETGNINAILWTINGVTIFVLSLAVGLLNTIYFMQRVGEYGVLAAVGYRVGFLVRRTLVEALVLTALGWVLGMGLSLLGNRIVADYLLGPAGLAVPPVSLRAVVFTLPIPVLIALFSLLTVMRRMIQMDPVSIVERRD